MVPLHLAVRCWGTWEMQDHRTWKSRSVLFTHLDLAFGEGSPGLLLLSVPTWPCWHCSPLGVRRAHSLPIGHCINQGISVCSVTNSVTIHPPRTCLILGLPGSSSISLRSVLPAALSLTVTLLPRLQTDCSFSGPWAQICCLMGSQEVDSLLTCIQTQ